PAPPTPVPRVVQGLNNDSFLPGTGAGAVRAGTTTATRATDETMSLDEAVASAIVPYASVTNPPKVRFKGTLDVPESVRAAGIQGRVEVSLTIDAEGRVTAIAVTASLTPEADEACRASLAKSRWKPGDRDGVPVITTNVPFSCKFEMTPD
ncbi:MAG: TonB family protein, partial [Myxococcota bacterium]